MTPKQPLLPEQKLQNIKQSKLKYEEKLKIERKIERLKKEAKKKRALELKQKKLEQAQIFQSKSSYVIDLELSGLIKHQKDKVEIMQYAIYRIDPDRNIKFIKTKYFSIEREVTDSAFETHGHTKADLAKHKRFNLRDAEYILNTIKGSEYIIGHNIGHDIQVMNNVFKSLGISSTSWPLRKDTNSMARIYLGHGGKLQDICKKWLEDDLDNVFFHEAKADAKWTAELYVSILKYSETLEEQPKDHEDYRPYEYVAQYK